MNFSLCKRVVIKIGSNILTDEAGKLDLNNMRRLVEQISELHAQGIQVTVVSSGAIVCGSERIGRNGDSMPRKQAAAAIGQSLLMNEYSRFFAPRGIVVAQLLLTHDIVEKEERMCNAQNTLSTLLAHGVVPIINENDSVATEEIKFGDNDALSVNVAELVRADVLIILTDIDGLYSKDPRHHADSELIDVVYEISEELLAGCGGVGGSGKGTGGMISKVCAARTALQRGIEVVVANGRRQDVLRDIFKGEKVGTHFVQK